MKIGYRPAQPKSTAPAAPSIRIGLPRFQSPTAVNRAEQIDVSDWPDFLKSDAEVPRRSAEADWTKPYGETND